MVAMAPEELTEDDRKGDGLAAPLERIIRVALAIYLTPVLLIVCAIGGASILYDKASRATARLSTPPSRGHSFVHFSKSRASQVGFRSSLARDFRRTRVGR